MLGQCRVSYERADLALKLRQARYLLDKLEAPNKHIYVLSDMQRVSWEERGEGRETRDEGRNPKSEIRNPKSETRNLQSPIPIILVDCDRAPKPNVAVQAVDIEVRDTDGGVAVEGDRHTAEHLVRRPAAAWWNC